jgi:DNA-binding Xre family transcriptional regulator
VIHRHLDYPAGTPATSLGNSAVDDLLDRGDLIAWQPLARAVAADPFGDLANRILHLIEAHPRYGTSSLWRAWITSRRVDMGQRKAQQRTLADLRRQHGFSQSELSQRVGMSQSDLSKAERRTDWKLSTLQTILSGLGLRLELEAVDSDGRPVATVVAVRSRTPPDQPTPSTSRKSN